MSLALVIIMWAGIGIVAASKQPRFVALGAALALGAIMGFALVAVIDPSALQRY